MVSPEQALWSMALVLGFLITITFGFWLLCRLTAEVCPQCGGGWQSEQIGSWTGKDDWHCHGCGHYWHVPYAESKE